MNELLIINRLLHFTANHSWPTERLGPGPGAAAGVGGGGVRRLWGVVGAFFIFHSSLGCSPAPLFFPPEFAIFEVCYACMIAVICDCVDCLIVGGVVPGLPRWVGLGRVGEGARWTRALHP